MKIASIQLSVGDQSKEQNIKHALEMVDQAPESDLIMLPEIWPSGFFSFDRYKTESEAITGQTVERFREKARRRNCHLLMGSFVEQDGTDYFNTTLLINPAGAIAAQYRKIHLFGYQSQETKILTPGEQVVVADTPWGRSGFSTCYDLRFPELFRKMVDLNAAFFFVVSAWPMLRVAAWRLFNQARAHENLAYLVSCNCAGVNNGTQFAGHSMIVDPLGNILAEAGEEEEIITAEIEIDLVSATRSEFPALADRVLS